MRATTYNLHVMAQTTRREALVTIAVGLSAGTLRSQQGYEPSTFSQEEYSLLGELVDMIIPDTETPGAKAVGVHSMLDEDLADGGAVLTTLRNGLARVGESGFGDMSEAERIAMLTAYSEGEGPDREFFDTLKGQTIDLYYATETGLVDELGYQGNTYLSEFPGCTHDHGIEDQA